MAALAFPNGEAQTWRVVLLRELLLLVSVLTLMFSADPPTSRWTDGVWTDGVAVQVAPQTPTGLAVIEQSDPGRVPANPAELDGPTPVLCLEKDWVFGHVAVSATADSTQLLSLEQPRPKHDVRVERERGPPPAANRVS